MISVFYGHTEHAIEEFALNVNGVDYYLWGDIWIEYSFDGHEYDYGPSRPSATFWAMRTDGENDNPVNIDINFKSEIGKEMLRRLDDKIKETCQSHYEGR